VNTKDALWREIAYGLCGAGGLLESYAEQDHVVLDMRLNPDSAKSEADYHWIVLRRVTAAEDNRIRYRGERYEIELLGLRSSATKGDDALEAMQDIVIDHFSGKVKTFGKFTADGTPDPTGGLKLKVRYIDTAEGFDQEFDEKAHILMFMVHHVRS